MKDLEGYSIWYTKFDFVFLRFWNLRFKVESYEAPRNVGVTFVKNLSNYYTD